MYIIKFLIEYEWEPFKVNHKQLIFDKFINSSIRLEKEKCSHIGAAVYKWQGKITAGDHKNKTGILIGETQDICRRVNQYKKKKKKTGNQYWREHFLKLGNIGFWILKLKKCILNNKDFSINLQSKNFRLVLEQLLVMELINKNNLNEVWIINKMQ